MDLAEKIIEFRAVNGMTQDEFATAVGIDRTSILHIEARNRVPRKVTAEGETVRSPEGKSRNITSHLSIEPLYCIHFWKD